MGNKTKIREDFGVQDDMCSRRGYPPGRLFEHKAEDFKPVKIRQRFQDVDRTLAPRMSYFHDHNSKQFSISQRFQDSLEVQDEVQKLQ